MLLRWVWFVVVVEVFGVGTCELLFVCWFAIVYVSTILNLVVITYM